jgi:hypothetical protein
MRLNYLILKDLRAYPALRGIRKNKKTKSLFARSLLAERAGQKQSLATVWHEKNAGETKKRPCGRCGRKNSQQKYYQRLP